MTDRRLFSKLLGYLALCRFLPRRFGVSRIPSWPLLVMLWCLGSLPGLFFVYVLEHPGEAYWAALTELMWSFLLLVIVTGVGGMLRPGSVSFRHGNRSGALGAVAAVLCVGFIAWAWASVLHVQDLVPAQ